MLGISRMRMFLSAQGPLIQSQLLCLHYASLIVGPAPNEYIHILFQEVTCNYYVSFFTVPYNYIFTTLYVRG